MCGIWASIGRSYNTADAQHQIEMLAHRGPEGFSVQTVGQNTLAFCRLAINGTADSTAMQPMNLDGVWWVCNGEIYNWKEVGKPISESDCSILGGLWAKLRNTPSAFFRALDGVFAMVICDTTTGITTIARDPYGIRPLFYGYGKGCVYVSSEMKSLRGLTGFIRAVEPGSYMQFREGGGRAIEEVRWHEVPWVKNPTYTPRYADGLSITLTAIRRSLRSAVVKRMMSDRPIAALLSGGLDSSLIAALVQQQSSIPIETFSIGFAGSQDLKYARMVAKYIGSKHTEIVVTPADFLKAIPVVIRDIESYDITTVRASVGNWMVAKAIRERSFAKVVFNGDGSDEVFGGYKYFHRAPDDEQFEDECGRLLSEIHMFDVLRSDRCISAHGLEARTPFLDKQFVEVARSVATVWRRPVRGIEKWILRAAFENEDLLPPEVLWRKKEAFSDGVSGPDKAWFEQIQEYVRPITRDWKENTHKYTYLRPTTPESYFYRDIFQTFYGYECQYIIPHMWMPRWSPETTDPSARTIQME